MPGVRPGVAVAASRAADILRFCSTNFRVTTLNTSSTPSPDSALISWQASQPTSWPQNPDDRFEVGLRGSADVQSLLEKKPPLPLRLPAPGARCPAGVAVGGGVELRPGARFSAT